MRQPPEPRSDCCAPTEDGSHSDGCPWVAETLEWMDEREPVGGYIPGPPIKVPIRYIREAEPGLHVVSIEGGAPEYVLTVDWIRNHPDRYPVGEPHQ